MVSLCRNNLLQRVSFQAERRAVVLESLLMVFGEVWKGERVADVGTILIVRDCRTSITILIHRSTAVMLLILLRNCWIIDISASFDVTRVHLRRKTSKMTFVWKD